VRGYLQTDARFFLNDKEKSNTNTFLLRRVRPIFEGTVFRDFDFRIMPDFGDGKVVLQDAYLDFHYWPEARLRAGKFKAPFGLERLQSATDLLFVERALPTNLVPNRDVGVQLHGELWNGALGYAVGVFNGVPDGGSADVDTNDGKDLAARLFAHPFRNTSMEPLKGLGVGMAVTTGSQQGTLPSFKTSGQATFFSYSSGVTADGRRLRLSPQAYYYWGPFGLLGEYVSSSQDVRKGADMATVKNSAWQLAASYVLTGEKASYKGVSPARPFDPKKGQWGAFELAARYSQLSVDKAAFDHGFADLKKAAKGANEWALGLNWYLNKNVKFSMNYESTAFDGGAASGDRKAEHAVMSRVQISF
jgi:phosphate-selective porin OprO/OprP